MLDTKVVYKFKGHKWILDCSLFHYQIAQTDLQQSSVGSFWHLKFQCYCKDSFVIPCDAGQYINNIERLIKRPSKSLDLGGPGTYCASQAVWDVCLVTPKPPQFRATRFSFVLIISKYGIIYAKKDIQQQKKSWIEWLFLLFITVSLTLYDSVFTSKDEEKTVKYRCYPWILFFFPLCGVKSVSS